MVSGDGSSIKDKEEYKFVYEISKSKGNEVEVIAKITDDLS